MNIGVVGGMGSYATLGFFNRYLDLFKAEKEWDRPRIVIDNRCTMPSRVRAILYNEKWNEVVNELTDSISLLQRAGCNRIVLACNTSHVFLDEVYKNIPSARGVVIHIIDTLAHFLSLNKENKERVYSLISTEGTILSGIYQRYFEKYNLKIIIPGEGVFSQLRFFIEAVKTNNYSDNLLESFIVFLKSQPTQNIILGCTEFPVIYNKMIERLGTDKIEDLNIYDPLEITLQNLYKEFKLENNT